MSKALSAAYLNHQISELESKVQQLPVSQDVQPHNGIKQVAGGHQQQGVQMKKGLNGLVASRIDDTLPGLDQVRARIDDNGNSDRELDHDDQDDKEDWRVAVVDVSGLMWAPKAVRNLVTRGFEVIVPTDGELQSMFGKWQLPPPLHPRQMLITL